MCLIFHRENTPRYVLTAKSIYVNLQYKCDATQIKLNFSGMVYQLGMLIINLLTINRH